MPLSEQLPQPPVTPQSEAGEPAAAPTDVDAASEESAAPPPAEQHEDDIAFGSIDSGSVPVRRALSSQIAAAFEPE